jgi:NAD(P)-dependent dehydrogenase (short-subunit alcohol dehydrogenase family)
VTLDVRDTESIKRLLPKLSLTGRLDVVINNGIKEIPMQEIKNNFETNFFGPIAVMQALPQMRVQNLV